MVNVAARLDSGPLRRELPKGRTWIEVDHEERGVDLRGRGEIDEARVRHAAFRAQIAYATGVGYPGVVVVPVP